MKTIIGYEVIIKEIVEKEVVEKGSFGVINQEFISTAQYNNLPFSEQKEWKISDDGTYMKNIFGYSPSIVTKKPVEDIIYTQKVDTLEVENVIKAINNINEES